MNREDLKEMLFCEYIKHIGPAYEAFDGVVDKVIGLIMKNESQPEPAPEFSLDWPYGWKTRNGRRARILCSELRGLASIAVAVELEDDDIVYRVTEKGRFWMDVDEDSLHDIFNSPGPV